MKKKFIENYLSELYITLKSHLIYVYKKVCYDCNYVFGLKSLNKKMYKLTKIKFDDSKQSGDLYNIKLFTAFFFFIFVL